MDEEVLTGEVESEPARALSPRQAVLLAAEHLRAANHDLNRDPGERPSVEVHQATIAGIAYGLTVVADRLADDEGLRPAVGEALEILGDLDSSMGARIGQARRRLMAAVNL